MGDRNGEGADAFTGLAQAPEANLFTGALSTGISIGIPPGRGHMTPNLALSYSSAAGPSQYGYGWNLPVGRIERTTRFGVPNCNSAAFDDFVIVLPGGASAELVEDPNNPGEFRPRVEQGYLWAKLDGNTWTARDATGITYTFGSTDNSRLATKLTNPPESEVNPDGTCGDFTTAWALTEAEDPNGNTISFTWTDRGGNGNNLLPHTVEYGGNSGDGGGGQLGHFHIVRFDWLGFDPTQLGAQEPTYRTGVEQRILTWLWRVRVETTKPPAYQFRTYTFYGTGVGALYQLDSVQSDDLPEQNFIYADWEGEGHAASYTENVHDIAFDSIRRWSGTLDVVRSILDMNGDGLLDLVKANLGSGNPWQVHFGRIDLGTGDFYFEVGPTSWDAPFHLIRQVQESGCAFAHYCTIRDTFDITGDGVADYVVAVDSEDDWIVYPGQMSAGGNWGFGDLSVPHSSRHIDWPAPYQRIRQTKAEWESGPQFAQRDVIDLTGDGLPDFLLTDLESGYWHVYRNTGTGFEAAPEKFAVPDAEVDHTGRDIVLSDFNGDGLADLLWSGHHDPPIPPFENPPGSGIFYHTGYISVYWNTGDGFAATPKIVTTPKGIYIGCMSATTDGTHAGYKETRGDIFDINGDGLPDCVYADQDDNWRALLNIGGDFEEITYEQDPVATNFYYASAPRVWPGVSGPLRLSSQNSNEGVQIIDLIDLNGDGLLDRVDSSNGGSSATWDVEINLQPVKPMVLTMMENGLGGTNTIKYEPSSHFPHVDEDGLRPCL